jgi:hypothetical protein
MKKIILALTMVMAAASGWAQVGPRVGFALPDSPVRLIASSQTNVATAAISQPFRLTASDSLGFYTVIGTTNSSTATVTYVFQVSQDGIIWVAPPVGSLWTTSTLAGTAPVATFTNAWNSGVLRNMNWIRVSNLTNGHTASAWVTNCWFMQH